MAGDPAFERLVAKTIYDLYADAHTRTAHLLARHIARRGPADPNVWAARKHAQISDIRRQLATLIAQLDRHAPTIVDDTLRQAGGQADEDAALELALDADGPFTLPRRPAPAVEQLARQTLGALKTAHVQILRTTVDVYRDVISETLARTLTGVDTRLGAAQAALDRWAMRGIAGFVDGAGRRWELETYAEMAVRTGTQRAYAEAKVDRFRGAGRSLVVVSDSPEECPLCRPWEGKVLSIDGRHVGTTVDGEQVVGTLSDATAAGLFHPNCTHTVGLFVPGLSRPRAAAAPAAYSARQRQREIERHIRRWKRRQAVALSPQAEAQARAKVRGWQAEMRTHLDRTGLFRWSEREQIGRAR